MSSPEHPKSPKTPRGSIFGGHGGEARINKFKRSSSIRDPSAPPVPVSTHDPTDHPGLDPDRDPNEEEPSFKKAYDRTISAAEEALELAMEGGLGFDASLRKPRQSRKSTSPKSHSKSSPANSPKR